MRLSMRARRLVIVVVALIAIGSTVVAAATALNDQGEAADASSQFQSPPAEMTPTQADAIPAGSGTYP